MKPSSDAQPQLVKLEILIFPENLATIKKYAKAFVVTVFKPGNGRKHFHTRYRTDIAAQWVGIQIAADRA